MSASRKRSKEKRKLEKKARKDSQRALYASYRDHGQNQKKGRAYHKANKRGVSDHAVGGRCGNIGCIRCSGISFTAFLDRAGVPRGMPQWMFQIWQKRNKPPRNAVR